MTKPTAFLAALLLACSSPRGAEPPRTPAPSTTPTSKPTEVTRIDAELTVRRIAEDAYVVTHEPFHASNVLVVRMPDGAVVICSSPFETEATRALVRWVKSTFSPTRILAINTHFHLDGSGGNEAYRELGVETWGTALTRKLVVERGERLRAGAADDFTGERRARVLATKILPAEHTFPAGSEHTIRFGDAEVRVIDPGAAHAPDNLLVFFPAQRVLFGGCMIKGSRTVGYVGDADLAHWEAAVEVARRTSPRAVVPGHGAPAGPELFDLTVDVVRAARAGAR